MPLEPTGLNDVLARIAEISSRFGPPPAPPVAQPSAPKRWEPSQTISGGPPAPPGPGRASMAYGLPPNSDDPAADVSTQSFNFEEALVQAAKRSGMDPKLLAAVVRVESGGDPRSRSHKGAMGLMQLMPETARDYGVKNPYDPLQNMTGGGKYLKNMIGMFGGDLSLGLAAYNAGEGAVARHKGIPPYKETQSFVRRVLDIYQSNQP